MLLRTLIAILMIVNSTIAFDLPQCDSNIKINNDHYNKSDTYNTGDTYPTDAHFDAFGNLFYVESGRNSDGFGFNIKIIKAGEDKARSIGDLPEGMSYSIAVDRKDHKVYFGTKKGIFSYNYESCSATPVTESNLTVNMIFVDKDGNKYISEISNGVEELYLLDGMKKIRFHTLEALNELAIDKNNNFYFIKEEKILVLKSTLAIPMVIGNVKYNGMAQINFHREKVFIASEKLIYFHENEIEILREVKKIPDKVTAVAFDDEGNFVIGVKGKIVKYKRIEFYIRDTEDQNNDDIYEYVSEDRK